MPESHLVFELKPIVIVLDVLSATRELIVITPAPGPFTSEFIGLDGSTTAPETSNPDGNVKTIFPPEVKESICFDIGMFTEYMVETPA